ncbi:hypothetical protein F5148DRAFT_294099 [Russula earlei]|uniref:Uncharacterized protein n=1 Tax=Russula earlei TaxID=71964 RepID=A0ACC0UP97_9AGAM|nr:hypothetical protein F5148DRAFT_294099 [Russula earlei]
MSISDNVDPIIASALASLQLISPEDIANLDDFCPICLLTFRSIFESRDDNLPGKPLLGVAIVGGCGHLFCVEDLSEWIKGRHGTCPTCRHEFLPELRPVDSDAESSDGGEYVPTEYDADSDFDTDYEDGFMDSDGIDLETMDFDPHHPPGDPEEAMAEGGDEDDSIASSRHRPGYHESPELEAQSVCGSEAAWYGSVEGEQDDWGLTDGDSMNTSEGEQSFRDRFLEPNVQVRLDSEGEYAIYEDGGEPKS